MIVQSDGILGTADSFYKKKYEVVNYSKMCHYETNLNYD